MGFYNRSPNELKELSLMINRLDTRAETLRKELGSYHPYYKEYETLFEKIGKADNVSVGKYGNLRLKRGKAFIDTLSDREINQLKKLEAKNLTFYHKVQEIKKEKDITEEEAKQRIKGKSYDEFIHDNLGVIYPKERPNEIVHIRGRRKTYDELEELVNIITGKKLEEL